MREPFATLTAKVVPLDRANVDTDAILPKQFMKSIRRTGFGDNLFDAWRFVDPGEPGQDVLQRTPDPGFALNQPCYAGARILLTRANFGCGSSREHAAWALRDWGIRAIVAPSFADIFFGNCIKNGMLPITLAPATVDALFAREAAAPGFSMAIDLAARTLTPHGGTPIAFDIDAASRQRLLDGLDDIDLTLHKADRIRDYEARRRSLEPWLFGESPQQ